MWVIAERGTCLGLRRWQVGGGEESWEEVRPQLSLKDAAERGIHIV